MQQITLKLPKDISMYSCYFHPKRPASWWSGHVHLHFYLGTVMIGWCDECHRIHAPELIGESATCKGCGGLLDAIR